MRSTEIISSSALQRQEQETGALVAIVELVSFLKESVEQFPEEEKVINPLLYG